MVTYPKDWEEKGLLDCVSLIQGLTYTPDNVKPHGTLVLRSSNIQEQRLSLEDNVYVNSFVPPEKMIQNGDILVCVRNGSASLIGKSCVLNKMSNTTFGAFMTVLRGDDTGYIAKIFESKQVQSQVRNRSSATINQITKKDFGSIRIFVPSQRSEQVSIANTLSIFDTYIDNLTELIEKKKGIRDGVLKDLVSGKTRLPGFSSDWESGKVGDILKIFYGKDEGYIETYSGKYPILATSGIIGNSDNYLCDWECVLIGRIGTIDQPIYMNTPFWTINTLYYSKPEPNQWAKFQYYLFCTINWYNYTESSGRPRLARKMIENIQIQIPPYEEQQAIAAVLTAMDEEIEVLETKLTKMMQIMEGTMEDLLTGRIRLISKTH